jgi:hypothetical protein
MVYGFARGRFLQKIFCSVLVWGGFFGWECRQVPAITLDFRLACDLGGTCEAGDFFFDHPEAVADLELVGQFYAPFADSLASISGASVSFTHPDTGAPGFGLGNFSVPADTVVIYVGGRDLSGNQVGVGGPGGPSGAFPRGQGTIVGGAADDFATWGGTVSFDTKTSTGTNRNWHFGSDTLPAFNQVDFLSVALHELGHVFGFGTSDSLENQVTGGLLQGAASTALYGGGVPMIFNPGTGRHEHIDGDVTSPPYADEPDPSFGASLRLGRRVLLTPLDYAALADVGWEVPSQLLGLHGNADGDGDVDGEDFLAWQRGQGIPSGGSALGGDLSGEGSVDEFDLWLWEYYYGSTSGAGGLAAGQVPEPATWFLGSVALWALMLSRSWIRKNSDEPPGP